MNDKISIGLIGYGYWGPNLLRNFNSHNESKVTYLADTRTERLILAKNNYPATNILENTDEIFKKNDVEAIVIATPVHTHFKFAKKALENGKHVLLEKPMASSVRECEELIELALKKNLVLMIDHTLLYTPSLRKIDELIKSGSIGDINYIDFVRINLGLFQPDINVLWDLSVHDLAVILYLIKENIYSIQATGISHTHNGIENIAYLTLNFKSDLIAHLSCSWSSPVKIRKLLIGGTKKMIVFDDIEPTEKIKVYDSGYTYRTDEDKNNILVDYRTGDIYVPKLDNTEALRFMVKDFINAVRGNSVPLSNYQLGINVIKILEASNLSIKNQGKEIIIK